MPKTYSKLEHLKILELHQQGLTNRAIVDEMQKIFPGKWTSTYAVKAVARIIQQYKEDSEDGSLSTPLLKSLDEMTKDERFVYVSSKIQKMPRFLMAFKNFDKKAKEVFVEEYLSVIRSTESLTEVEEQALFSAVLELVLALQALSRKEQEEIYYQQSMDRQITSNDPRFRTSVDDKYQKEYDQHMKLYNTWLKTMKMSREQRLKEIRSDRKSLVDLAEELSHKSVQSQVIKEIMELSKLRDKKSKTMIDKKYILGSFED